METAACGSEIDWKISYKDLFLKIQERDARMEGQFYSWRFVSYSSIL